MSKLFRDLKEHVHSVIPYPQNLRELIGNAEVWQRFCSLPQEIKNTFIFPGNSAHADIGYKLRTKDDGRDSKEYYHYDGHHEDYFEQFGLRDLIASTPELSDFFNFCKNLFDLASSFLIQTTGEMDAEMPGLRSEFEASKEDFLIRFLHYFPTQTDEVMAQPHFDRIYTLHLYENYPGLQYMDKQGQWHDVPISKDHTVIFSGYKLEKRSGGECPATWHRVRNLKHQYKGIGDRYSIVLFADLHSVEGYDLNARAQVMGPSYGPKAQISHAATSYE